MRTIGGLERWRKQYEAWKADKSLEKPSRYSVARQWTQEKPEWANKTSRSPVDYSFINLGSAFKNFSRRKTKYPKKHKRSQGISFQVAPDKAAIVGNQLRLPNIDYVKLRDSTLPWQNHRLHSTAHRISLVRDSRLRLSRRT